MKYFMEEHLRLAHMPFFILVLYRAFFGCVWGGGKVTPYIIDIKDITGR